jgi:arginase
MRALLVPYHLDEHLPDLDVPLAPDGLIAPELHGDTRAARMAGIFAALAAEVASADELPIVLTGDCTAAVGVVAGLQRRGVDPAVVWFDAHGDLNTPQSSTSGYPGGMAMRNLLTDGDPAFADGLGLRRIAPDRAVLVDGRDLDPAEVDYLAHSAVRQTTVAALARGDADLPAGPLYLHVDLDVVDGAVIPALLYPTPGGPDLTAVGDAIAAVLGTGRVAALTLACTWRPGLGAADAVRPLVARLRP